MTLSLEDGSLLIGAARAAIENHLSGKHTTHNRFKTSTLTKPQGVFVTLLNSSSQRELRGCIGNPFPERPLLDHVALMAVEAATSDPRFPPIGEDELQRIVIEVSVLTVPEIVRVNNPLEYRDKIVVGRDGVVVEGMGHRGLLLPQVAVEERFDSEEFLSQCCLKAGLLPDSWLSGNVNISRFQGQVFSEDEPRGRVFERDLQETT